ncbi:MAG: hypothetical protein H6673_12185 [Anaerolineales bacterium]|nr:hypothetical protein [Anaerolineales bacterium]
MFEIQFKDELVYAFVKQLLVSSTTFLKFDDNNHAFEVENTVIAELISRIDKNFSTVVPIAGSDYDEWIVIASSQLEVDRTLQQLNRFLLPTYGSYFRNVRFPKAREFEKAPPNIASIYYSWYSPVDLRSKIIDSLATWLKLTTISPSLDQMIPPNFKDLYRRFRFALSNQNWNEAEQIITKLRNSNLAPSHNIAFLRIELLAQQQNYEAIWLADDLKKWVFHAVPIPRRVQVALLKAFHHQKLLAAEQSGDYETIFSTLRQEQPALEKLLAYRHDIIDDFVVRVFAYFAVINETVESFNTLCQIESLNDETKEILAALKVIIQPAPSISSIDRFQQLIQEQKYDAAFTVASDIDDKAQRVSSLIQATAFLSKEKIMQGTHVLEILETFEELGAKDKASILANPLTKLALQVIRNYETEFKTTEIYTDWIDWFDALFSEHQNSEQLYKSLDYLEENSDKEYWTINNVERLWEYLGTMTFNLQVASPQDQAIVSQPYFERAIGWLVNQFTEEDAVFPREQTIYGKLYGVFLDYIVHSTSTREENADKLFRLADDQLNRKPSDVLITCQSIFQWLGNPRPEGNTIALETFELAVKHGLGKEHLYKFYREWIEKLMDSPIQYDRPSLEVWLSLGEWFGDEAEYLVNKVLKRLDRNKSGSLDPISQLPDGYRIVIYTLDETSAGRVKKILAERQPNLQIDICADAVVTDQMKSITQNADMHVLVWRCMKHSVYYGITPYIDEPVRPISRGSSSILRAIEERSQSLIN